MDPADEPVVKESMKELYKLVITGLCLQTTSAR